MSIITINWVNKRMYRMRPKFMPRSTIGHPFDYSYCIFGYSARRKVEEADIRFVGFDDDGNIMFREEHEPSGFILTKDWNDGFWELSEEIE